MPMESAPKEGRTTSEFAATKSSGIWGIIAMVLGLLTTTVGPLLANMGAGEDETATASPWSMVAGAIVAAAGGFQNTHVDPGNVGPRTALKAEALKNGGL